MSIDTDLNRIATSLEEIVKHLKATPVSLGTPGKTVDASKKAASTPKNAPAAVVPAEYLLAPETAITQEEVHAKLQVYMEKNGVEMVKAVMIKHGASKVKPTITSIPAANYAALAAEIG